MDPISRDGQATESTTRLLRQIEFFKNVDYSALRTMLSASRQVTLRRGRALFAEHERASSGFFLMEGHLQLSSKTAGASSVVTAPAFLGESALIVETTRPATAIAETDSTLIEITRLTFLRVIAEYPESAAHLKDMMARRLAGMIASLDAVRVDIDALTRG